jgi:exopolysaccharide biosynthesis polyprenyl glycosylphosphotransferase
LDTSTPPTIEKASRPTVARNKAQQWLWSQRRKRLQVLIYLLADFLMSFGVWLAFVVIRRQFIEGRIIELESQQFLNAGVIATYWTLIYAIAGLYRNPFRKSRLQEIIQIFKYTVIGVLIIFFAIFLDDSSSIPGYQQQHYHFTLTTYFSLQLLAVAILRLIITTRTQILIRNRKIGFPTLIVGCGEQAYTIYQELTQMRRSLGYRFKGFVSLSGSRDNMFFGKLKHFGTLDDLFSILISRDIEEVIIALEKDEAEQIGRVIEICEQTNTHIKVVPGVYDFIVGSVKVSHILGAPLIEVFPQIMKPWEVVAKRLFDVAFSLFALLLLLPVYLVLTVLIKLDSPGPVLYRQERVGRGGKPFFINKFRSMYVDAEKMGPQLSSAEDPRITRVGRYLRKLRLDELPQFWNVLIGEMSIVGPRPERQHYIDQIVKKAPHYRHLHKIRPGITSWGQVKYGYAENVDEMVRRLQFDILYLENMSLALDIRIILYTVIVMLEGRGK